MADENLNYQPNDETATRPGSHFSVPASDELNALMDELEAPIPSSKPASYEPDDELEAIAQAYVGNSAVPAPSYGDSDDEVPSFSSAPSSFTPNPYAAPLQGAVPLATPAVEFSGSPGDTIPQPFDELASRINTEGPALYTQDVLTVPAAPSTPQQDALGASGPFEPVKIQTNNSQETGAPRPISVDPSSSGAFHTLSAGEGAVIPTRDTASSAKEAALSNLSDGDHSRRSGSLRDATSHQVASSQNARASRSTKANKKLIVAIVAIAVLLGAAGFFFITQVINRGAANQHVADKASSEQVAAVDESVLFGGYEYRLKQAEGGTWSIVRSSSGGSSSSAIALLPGAPVSLVLCEGALYVPENVEGGWDVVALMLADGSELTQLQMGDGTRFGGQGSAASASLSDKKLTVTDANGQQYVFDLAA